MRGNASATVSKTHVSRWRSWSACAYMHIGISLPELTFSWVALIRRYQSTKSIELQASSHPSVRASSLCQELFLSPRAARYVNQPIPFPHILQQWPPLNRASSTRNSSAGAKRRRRSTTKHCTRQRSAFRNGSGSRLPIQCLYGQPWGRNQSPRSMSSIFPTTMQLRSQYQKSTASLARIRRRRYPFTTLPYKIWLPHMSSSTR